MVSTPCGWLVSEVGRPQHARTLHLQRLRSHGRVITRPCAVLPGLCCSPLELTSAFAMPWGPLVWAHATLTLEAGNWVNVALDKSFAYVFLILSKTWTTGLFGIRKGTAEELDAVLEMWKALDKC